MAKHRPQLVDTARWRSSLKDEGKVLSIERFATVNREGGLAFVASTDTPDRYGDVVSQDGWDLAAYQKNPVLLWAHDYSTPPVGRVGRMVVEPGCLKASEIEWTPREVSEFGAEIGRMVEGGFLSTVSVGFLPSKFEDIRDEASGEWKGYRFIEQELLELSVTPVPANAEALAVRGFVAGLKSWAYTKTDSIAVSGWQAHARQLLKQVDDAQAKAEENADGDAMAEMVALLREIAALQKEANAYLKAMSGEVSLSIVEPELAKAVAATETPLVKALSALFTR
jgi:HK97 family phage prohead protease